LAEKEAESALRSLGARDGKSTLQLYPHAFKESVIAPIRPGASLAMTTITRNLPWFVKDLGVSIVGQVRASRLGEGAFRCA